MSFIYIFKNICWSFSFLFLWKVWIPVAQRRGSTIFFDWVRGGQTFFSHFCDLPQWWNHLSAAWSLISSTSYVFKWLYSPSFIWLKFKVWTIIIITTVPTQIVDTATILGFGLFGAATIKTEFTIILIFILDPKNIHFFTKKYIF